MKPLHFDFCLFQCLSHTENGRWFWNFRTIKAIKIRKPTNVIVIISTNSAFACVNERLCVCTFWKSAGNITRNDIFEISTRGSFVSSAFLSVLVSVSILEWRLSRFAWLLAQCVWSYNKIISRKREKQQLKGKFHIFMQCVCRNESNQMAIMMIHTSNDSYVHYHFIATFHTLKHDCPKSEAVSEWRFKYGWKCTYRSHLGIHTTIRFDKCCWI